MTVLACIGVGANQGDRKAQCVRAVAALAAADRITVTAVSSWYETEPVGPVPQGDFINGVVAVETDLPAAELLALCLSIEQGMGRQRTVRWGPRTIDLDLLLYGDRVICEDQLTVPHPEMASRAFVMLPLAEIAPDLTHPLNGLTMAEMAARLRSPAVGDAVVRP